MSNLILVKNGNAERLELLKEQHIDKELSSIFVSSLIYGQTKLSASFFNFKFVTNFIPEIVSSPFTKLSNSVSSVSSSITDSIPEPLTQTVSKLGSVISTLPIIVFGSMSAYHAYNMATNISNGDYAQAQSDFYKSAFFGGASIAAVYYPYDTIFGVNTVCGLYSLYKKVEVFDTVIERMELTGDTSFIFDLNSMTVIV